MYFRESQTYPKDPIELRSSQRVLHAFNSATRITPLGGRSVPLFTKTTERGQKGLSKNQKKLLAV